MIQWQGRQNAATEELIGHTVMEKFPGIEHAAIFDVSKNVEEPIPFHLENEFIFPDATTAWFELSFQPVPEGLFILLVDITDRKKKVLENSTI